MVKINKKALIVEDTKYSQELFCLYFSDLNWQESVVISSSEAALKILESKTHIFDVIVLDLKLPGMNGLETFKEAKKVISNLPPVIVITGNPENSETEDEAKTLGVKAFLYKGEFKQKDFEKIVKSIIKKGS